MDLKGVNPSAGTKYILAGSYFTCAGGNQTQWLLSASQVGSLAVSDVALTGSKLSLVGTNTSSPSVSNLTWSGSVSGTFSYSSDIAATALVQFSSVDGVQKLTANATYRSSLLDVDLRVTFDHTSLNCTTPAPIAVTDSAKYLVNKTLLGEAGTATMTLKNVGETNLVVNCTAVHDYCDDVWFITANLDQAWTVRGIKLNYVNISLMGYRNPNDLTKYRWVGSVKSAALITEIGLLMDVAVQFDTELGLQGVNVILKEKASFGTIDVTADYYPPTNCSLAPSFIKGKGQFVSNFTDSNSLAFALNTTYDFCSKVCLPFFFFFNFDIVFIFIIFFMFLFLFFCLSSISLISNILK